MRNSLAASLVVFLIWGISLQDQERFLAEFTLSETEALGMTTR
jgi:hypothetical protein